MLYSIKGNIIEQGSEGTVILENNGIAYEVWGDKELCESGVREVTVYTVFLPSENEWRLFGFLKKEKRRLFQLLMTVNGLGAKTAMKILFDASVREITRSILENDLTYLSTLPNVGKKTAERIVLELKTKIKTILPFLSLETETEENNEFDLTVFHQANEALEALGYSPIQSRKVLRELFSEKKNWDLEDILKAALKKTYIKDN
jgi:Holliday junction DNA helicase RuvA